jgi:hypothetical protein
MPAMVESSGHDGHPVKVKTARSRFILLDQLSSHDSVAHINWNDLLPSESDEQFYSSVNTQIDFA